MKTLISFGVLLFAANIAHGQYFQRHAASRLKMNYLGTETSFSSFKDTVPVFNQSPSTFIPNSFEGLKKENSSWDVLKNPDTVSKTSLQKAIQYHLEYEKQKIDLRPLLQLIYSVYEYRYMPGYNQLAPDKF